LQQPFGHDAELQAHDPPTHAWPATHTVQVPPEPPHAPVVLPVSQPAASQQPLAHMVASQTHVPAVTPVFMQSRPAAHAAHAAPPSPHWPTLSLAYATQVATPLTVVQQPEEQVVALQAHDPLTQAVFAPHDAHAAPPLPQYVLFSAVWQFPLPSQQPFGQDAGLQTHDPPTHARPAAQAPQAFAPVPHWPAV
jgi:hypothetical protein